MKLGETKVRAPLLTQYGNWIVLGPAVRVESPSQVWKVPCVCCLHGTRRYIPESELRVGSARRCRVCVRSRTAVVLVPRLR